MVFQDFSRPLSRRQDLWQIGPGAVAQDFAQFPTGSPCVKGLELAVVDVLGAGERVRDPQSMPPAVGTPDDRMVVGNPVPVVFSGLQLPRVGTCEPVSGRPIDRNIRARDLGHRLAMYDAWGNDKDTANRDARQEQKSPHTTDPLRSVDSRVPVVSSQRTRPAFDVHSGVIFMPGDMDATLSGLTCRYCAFPGSAFGGQPFALCAAASLYHLRHAFSCSSLQPPAFSLQPPASSLQPVSLPACCLTPGRAKRRLHTARACRTFRRDGQTRGPAPSAGDCA